MSLVSVLRENEPLLTYRRIEIFLNGTSVGYFPKGKSKEFDLPAGQHKIKANKDIDFTFSIKRKNPSKYPQIHLL